MTMRLGKRERNERAALQRRKNEIDRMRAAMPSGKDMAIFYSMAGRPSPKRPGSLMNKEVLEGHRLQPNQRTKKAGKVAPLGVDAASVKRAQRAMQRSRTR